VTNKGWLKTRKEKLEVSTVRTMTMLVIKLTRKIKEEKLSGQVLKNRTGRLVDRSPRMCGSAHDDIVGRFRPTWSMLRFMNMGEKNDQSSGFSSEERAGPAMVKTPAFRGLFRTGRSGKVIKSETAECFVFAQVYQASQIVMPERSFMRSALPRCNRKS